MCSRRTFAASLFIFHCIWADGVDLDEVEAGLALRVVHQEVDVGTEQAPVAVLVPLLQPALQSQLIKHVSSVRDVFYVVQNGAVGAASLPHLGNVPDCWDVYEGAVDDVSVQHEGHVVHRALAAGPGVAAQHLVLAEHLHTPVSKYLYIYVCVDISTNRPVYQYLDVCRYIYYPPTLAMDVLPTPVSPSITIVAEWTASVKHH